MRSAWIPRLERGEMPVDLAAYLEPRVARLGYLGEWFRCAGNAPQVLLQFMHFTDALKDAVPLNVSEAVVLTVATLLDNPYERNQHERLCVRSGFGTAWVSEVERLAPDAASTMTGPERAAQRYAIAAVREDVDAIRQCFAELADHFTAAEGVAIVLLVGRYWAHALGVRTLGLAPPVPSIHEDGFTG